MRIPARVSLMVMVLSMAVGVEGSREVIAADGAPATGTITGRVVDAKGNPAKGVNVRAVLPGAMAERKKDGGKAAEGPGTANGKRPIEVLAKATTAEDGTFTLTGVPAGRVRVIAGLKGVGVGMLKEPVVVKAGETVAAGDLKLREPGVGAGGERKEKGLP